MQIHVNNQLKDIHSHTIADVIGELGYNDMRLALAMDGHFVPRSQWGEVKLHPDVKLEIVAPMQGG